MPHQTLKLVGGVIENETPVINQTGIAVSNRIRFRPDPQGLSLPEKLGGWAKFFASTITNGVVRALWGWQDTNNNQWIALGTDNTTSAELAVIQCTVSGSTGLTTASGALKDITPAYLTSLSQAVVGTTAGSSVVAINDSNGAAGGFPPFPNVDTTKFNYSIYVTTPISVGGLVIYGQYNIQSFSTSNGGASNVIATDILGNQTPALWTSTSAAITSVTFTSGTPNTLTVHFTGPYTAAVGSGVNILVDDGSISGSYIVISSTSTSFTVATLLGSYTFSTSGTWNNTGTSPLFNTLTGSYVITTTFPNHGFNVGDPFDVLNPTLVGGLTLQGTYTVTSVPNAYTFTFNASGLATATSYQWQGAITITGGSATGTSVTVTYPSTIFKLPLGSHTSFNPYTQGINPATWNGNHLLTSFTTSSSTYTDSAASTGSWVSGGSISGIGGMAAFIYTSTAPSNSISPLTTYSFGPAIPAAFWTLDSWGNDLIAVPGQSYPISYPTLKVPYQPIYYWDATGVPSAQAIAAGPQASNGAFVAMPQRQIVAWGSTFGGIIDPLLIRWCDVNNFNTWVAQVTNQAGSFRLPSGAAIIGARQVFQQGLIWTDIELWSMQYIGQSLVYGFNKIGQGCGLIGKYAHGVLGGVTYWMGKTQIFMLSGDGVMPIPCPIWDVAFQDLDLVNAGKIVCATNSMFQEVAWYFPVKSGSGENSQYIKYNVSTSTWDYGTLDRSAWIDVSVLQQPIGFSPVNHLIYQHEISPDADGAAMGEFFTTGWFAIADGDQMPFTDQWWPDMRWGYYGQTQNASVTLTFAGQDYPGQTIYPNYGPYTVTQATTYISPRIRHRLQSFTVSGTGTGTWWRLGGIRYRWQPDGRY